MDTIANKLRPNTNDYSQIYQPIFFRLTSETDRNNIDQLLSSTPGILIDDHIKGQLHELIKNRNPGIKLSEDAYSDLIEDHLAGCPVWMYGVWVYYSWSKRLVHILDEEEYIEMRTIRNRYKLTLEEQQLLRTKKIGIIGLSVGQSIALTLTMERLFGELRLADFDELELSNMNRIRTGVHHIGLSKVVITAREIAEIDPFLKIVIYPAGITQQNIDAFFTKGGPLDLLIEEADGLEVKIQSRFKARALGIPVVMDTNDRGMIDIERYDLEPNRPILHGLIEGINPDTVEKLTNQEKIPYLLRMIGADTISTKLKLSFLEVDESITSWPQLASSVVLGGALCTDACRRIFLNEYRESGRFYVDMEALIGPASTPSHQHDLSNTAYNPYQPLILSQLPTKINGYDFNAASDRVRLTDQQREALTHAAWIAPSAGNSQPWKWVINKDVFFLFHDKARSYNWINANELLGYLGLGTAVENVSLKALELGLEAVVTFFPHGADSHLVASISFREKNYSDKQSELLLPLARHLEIRHTNRKLGIRQELPDAFYHDLEQIMSIIPGVGIHRISEEHTLKIVEDLVAACDRQRLLEQRGHAEFFREIRWSDDDAKRGDGISVNLLDLTLSEKAGLKMANDWNAVQFLAEWNKGKAFEKLARKSIAGASSMILVSMPAFTSLNFLLAGQAVQRGWIYANMHSVAFHPMLSPVIFLNHLKFGKEAISSTMKSTLLPLRNEYDKLFDLKDGREGVFLFKLGKVDSTLGKAHRLPFEDVFLINH